MEKLTIKQIVKITNGILISGDENIGIESFSKDTRTIQKGDIYVGIKGESFDGNKYYKQAFEKGAIACILEKQSVDNQNLNQFPNIILVDDTVKALQDLEMVLIFLSKNCLKL